MIMCVRDGVGLDPVVALVRTRAYGTSVANALWTNRQWMSRNAGVTKSSHVCVIYLYGMVLFILIGRAYTPPHPFF